MKERSIRLNGERQSLSQGLRIRRSAREDGSLTTKPHYRVNDR